MHDSIDARVGRYIDGDLPAAEQRHLAQAALDDPELFDALTAAALLKESVREEASPRRPRVAVWLGAAVAAAAVLSLVIYRGASSTGAPDATAQAPARGAAVEPGPALGNLQPVILTAGLAESAGAAAAEFRSEEQASRLPRRSGRVTSSTDGEVEIDLGSLDGITKGSIVRIVRGSEPAPSIGTATMTAVFRERSRGRIGSGAGPLAGDRAEVAPDTHLAALSERVVARAAAGDPSGARTLAEQAAAAAEAPGVGAGARRLALYQAAILEHEAGAVEDAVRHLRLAAGQLDALPAAARAERARVLSALGAALGAQGQDVEAEQVLQSARPLAAGRVAVHVANNLAALASRRGDRTAADALYRSALAEAGGTPDLDADRRVVQRNLDALTSLR